MVFLTEAAIDQLEALREQNELDETEGVTLIANERGELGFAVSVASEADEVHEREGRTVLIVPQPLIAPLSEVTIDYVDTAEAQGFTLSAPE